MLNMQVYLDAVCKMGEIDITDPTHAAFTDWNSKFKKCWC